MSLPTTGEPAGSTFAPAPAAAPTAASRMTRVDWAPVPRVNLLPPEISADRQLHSVQRWLAAGVVATLLIGGAGTVLAQRQANSAQDELIQAQKITVALNDEKAEYAQIPKLIAQIEQAQAMRESAMATDVHWYEYMNDLAQATPTEVTLTSVSIATAGGATAGAPAASTDPLAPAGIGAISFAATARRYPDVASWMEAMNAVPGFDNSYVSQLSREDKAADVTFVGTVTITNDALSHDFDRKKS